MPSLPGKETSGGAAEQLQSMRDKVGNGLRLSLCDGNVNQGSDNSDEDSVHHES